MDLISPIDSPKRAVRSFSGRRTKGRNMRILIQRVRRASVGIGGSVRSSIGRGLLVLVGIGPDDGEDDVRYLCEKLVKLRIFDDEAGVMNRSVVDAGGDVLVVSQFTLYASTRKGNRPSGRARGGRAALRAFRRRDGEAARTARADGRVRSRYAGRTGERRAGNDLDRFETERILTTYKGGRI